MWWMLKCTHAIHPEVLAIGEYQVCNRWRKKTKQQQHLIHNSNSPFHHTFLAAERQVKRKRRLFATSWWYAIAKKICWAIWFHFKLMGKRNSTTKFCNQTNHGKYCCICFGMLDTVHGICSMSLHSNVSHYPVHFSHPSVSGLVWYALALCSSIAITRVRSANLF